MAENPFAEKYKLLESIGTRKRSPQEEFTLSRLRRQVDETSQSHLDHPQSKEGQELGRLKGKLKNLRPSNRDPQ